MRTIAQSTTPTVCFLMVDSTDHVSGKTGLTVTVKLFKNGGVVTTSTNSASQIDATNLPGWYSLALTATETDSIGDLILRATASGADQSDRLFAVEAADLTNIDNEVDAIQSIVTSNLDAAVSTRLATSGYTVPPSTASIASAVWSVLTSALTTAGSIGKLLVDRIDAVLSSRSSQSSVTALGSPMQAGTRIPGDYPSIIAYDAGGAISSVTWSTGKVWTYHYTGTDLTSITEA